MKTIAELAAELKVTKPAVRRYLTENVRKEFTETKDGIIYISEQGIELIKSNFLKNKSETRNKRNFENISANKPETISDNVSMLISMLQNELEIKNKQIEELTATVRIQAETAKATQHNELAETILDGQEKLSAPASEKVSLWNKIFKKKGGN